MVRTKLVNMNSGALESYEIDSMPTYLAASHAWSDNMFAINTPYKETLGGSMIEISVRLLFPEVVYCWIDTICIDQTDEEDKKCQIPLMGNIYGRAEAVVVVTNCEFVKDQSYLDELTKELDEAIAISLEEDYTESMSGYWQHGPGRLKIVEGMDFLEIFTRTRWADRIWTLQEYILAQNVVWVGKGNVCLRIDDVLFRALPDLCDVLDIQEAIGGKYSKIFEFYSGMVGAAAGKIDRTRVMELLGNRTASFPDDEIYGAMAASGVLIEPGVKTGQDNVWAAWWEEAIRQGNHRWFLLPPVIFHQGRESRPPNCVMPNFKVRGQASQNSGLDTVRCGTDAVKIVNGSVGVTARLAGSCRVIRRLGRIHQDVQGSLHRDITLILFAAGSWKLAISIVAAFGGGRYETKEGLAIAQILKTNHRRAALAVGNHKERDIVFKSMTAYQRTVWADFMRLVMSQMISLNDGIAYLAEVRNGVKGTDIVIVTDGQQELEGLHALDFGVTTASEKSPFMIVAAPTVDTSVLGPESGRAALHKVGMSIPTLVCNSRWRAHLYKCHVVDSNAQTFRIGGQTCWVCSAE